MLKDPNHPGRHFSLASDKGVFAVLFYGLHQEYLFE
jgi:hypothetical protein